MRDLLEFGHFVRAYDLSKVLQGDRIAYWRARPLCGAACLLDEGHRFPALFWPAVFLLPVSLEVYVYVCTLVFVSFVIVVIVMTVVIVSLLLYTWPLSRDTLAWHCCLSVVQVIFTLHCSLRRTGRVPDPSPEFSVARLSAVASVESLACLVCDWPRDCAMDVWLQKLWVTSLFIMSNACASLWDY